MLVSLACSSTVTTFPSTVATLTLDDEERVDLTKTSVVRYRLDLDANRYVEFELDQEGVDAVLSLLSAEGEIVATADGPGGAAGDELLATIVRDAGEYYIEVSSKTGAPEGGSSLRWLVDRPATAGDGHRVQAVRDWSEAQQRLTLRTRSEDRRAAEQMIEAADAWRAAGDPRSESWARIQSARASLRLQDVQAALQQLELATQGLQASEDAGRAAVAQSMMGTALEVLDRFDEALDHYQRAHDLAEQAGNDKDRAAVLNNMGSVYMARDQPEIAKSYFRKALELVRKLGNHIGEVTGLINLGRASEQLGEPERAFELYEQAEQLLQRHGSHPHWRLHLLANLGNYHLAAGELARALDLLRASLKLAQETDNLPAEMSFHQLLGRLYRTLGQREMATVHHQLALELARSLDNPKDTAASLLSLGILEREQGDLKAALGHLNEAKEAAAKSEAKAIQAAALREIGSLRAASGDVESGIDDLLVATELARESGVVPELARTLRALAEAQHLQGREEAARSTLHRAVRLNLRLDNPIEYGESHVRLARLERDAGQAKAARDLYLVALEVHRAIRSEFHQPDLRASFLSRWREHYQEYVELLMDLAQEYPGEGHADEAFRVSEGTRARKLVELLAESRILPNSGEVRKLSHQEEELATLVSLLQSELMRAAGAEPEVPRIVHLRDRLADARDELSALQRELRRRDPAYARIHYPEPLDLEASQNLLNDDEALLVYTLGTKRSYLFVVRRDRFDVRLLPGQREIDGLVDGVRNSLQQYDPRSRLLLERNVLQLRSLLLQPALDLLDGVERLWIVPDGSLFYLPVELLLTEPGDSETSLLHRLVVSYVPSASALADLTDLAERREPRTPSSDAVWLVAFGAPADDGREVAMAHRAAGPAGSRAQRFDELPGSVEEVESIAALFPGRARVYLGPEAHQGNVFGNPEVGATRWLHFASHGLIREDDPGASSLVLSPDVEGDSLLQVFEIFELKLTADLVVLSACETGIGGTGEGGGLVGLSHAFFYAGSPSVLVSLWPVSDPATVGLMKRFYGGLAKGLPPSEALRDAKIDMMKGDVFSHPRFWAPFVLVGDDR